VDSNEKKVEEIIKEAEKEAHDILRNQEKQKEIIEKKIMIDKFKKILGQNDHDEKKLDAAILTLEHLCHIFGLIILVGFTLYVILALNCKSEIINSFVNIYEKTLFGIFPLMGASLTWLFKEKIDIKKNIGRK